MKLTLSEAQLNVIRDQVLAAYPSEACGLLTGSQQGGDVLVNEVWPATNLLADVAGRFELDPRYRLRVEKICRGTVHRVVGHWHSHPLGDAKPSATDLDHAYEPDLVWLIVATDGLVISDIQAFYPPQMPGESFAPVKFIVGPSQI